MSEEEQKLTASERIALIKLRTKTATPISMVAEESETIPTEVIEHNEEVEKTYSDAEKIMFKDDAIKPEKVEWKPPVEIEKPKMLRDNFPPREGIIKGKTYKKDEVDPAQRIIPTSPDISKAEKKLNQELNDELAKINKIVKDKVNPEYDYTSLDKDEIKEAVDYQIGQYLDGKEAHICKLFAKAVDYDYELVKPIIDGDQSMFRQIEDTDYITLALAIKGVQK